MTAAQTAALILLGAILLGAITAALYEAAGRYIARHVEAAFNDHAYDAITLANGSER